MSPLRAFISELLAERYADAESASQLCASLDFTPAPEAPGDAVDRWKRTVEHLDDTQLDALFEGAARQHPDLFTRAHLDTLVSASERMTFATERMQANDVSGAATALEAALALHTEVFGTMSGPTATLLEALGLAYARGSAFALSAQRYERALTVREARFGDADPSTLVARHQVARALARLGRDAEADPLYRRVIADLEADPERDEERFAHALREFGHMLIKQHSDEQGMKLLSRALETRERIYPKGDGRISESLVDIARLNLRAEKFDRAEAMYTRAVTDLEARFGPDNPGLASALMHLALFHHARGHFDAALPIYERSRALFESSPIYPRRKRIGVLDNLAMLRHARGECDLAEPLEREARDIVLSLEESERLGFGQLSTNLAIVLLAQGRVAEAVPLLDEAIADGELSLRAMLPRATTSRVGAYLEGQLDAADVALALALRPEPSAWRTALTATLLRKGRSLDEAALLASSNAPSDPVARAKVERLRALRQELAARSLAGPHDETLAAHRARLSALCDESESIEQELADLSAQAREARTPPSPEVLVDRVAATLSPDAVLIEFTLAEPWEFDARRTHLATGESHYLAMVLHADSTGESFDLGPSSLIDAAVARFLSALTPEDPSARDAELLACDAAKALYALAMKPLEGALRSKTRLFLSLDGALWLAPFAALHDGASYLIDRVDLAYLSSGRDLVSGDESVVSTGAMVAFADPDFMARLERPSRGVKRRKRGTKRALSFAELPRLPGTRREAEAVARCFSHATIFTDERATASALLAVEAPAVLHVATHGFFLDDEDDSKGDTRDAVIVDDEETEEPADAALDPLLRSALVMAGARAKTASGDDAIATALEVSSMNLRGTQLVVFSACDTGRGEVRARDGVYGLRRAVFLASAESLVMSLWQVDDDATSALMSDFYDRLSRGTARARALRDASLAVRETRPHPYYWAPFVLMGRTDALCLDAQM